MPTQGERSIDYPEQMARDRAEIERLREQVASLQMESGYEASLAQLEIERLRAALVQIVCVADDNANAQHIEMAVPFMREVAANALGRTENEAAVNGSRTR